MIDLDKLALVEKSFRYAAECADSDFLTRWADSIADIAPDRLFLSCPVCAEVTCDEGCPMENVQHNKPDEGEA